MLNREDVRILSVTPNKQLWDLHVTLDLIVGDPPCQAFTVR